MTHYKRAKLEKFGLYLQPDGLLTRLTTYKDLSCECPRVQQKQRAEVGDYIASRATLGSPPERKSNEK